VSTRNLEKLFAPRSVALIGASERAHTVGAVTLKNLRSSGFGGELFLVNPAHEMLAGLKQDTERLADPDSERTAYPTPGYALADHSTRSIKPEYFIAVGICTHLGCSPSGPFAAGENSQLSTDPGFVCPCHGSTFDLAGRVFKNKPASDNLQVPPHKYLADKRVLIGDDSKA